MFATCSGEALIGASAKRLTVKRLTVAAAHLQTIIKEHMREQMQQKSDA
jgi:hypothetical protein